MIKKFVSGFVALIIECRKALIGIVEFSTEDWDTGNSPKFIRMLSFWASTAIFAVILVIEAYALFTGQLMAVAAASSPLTMALTVTTVILGIFSTAFLACLYLIDKEE